MAQLKSADITGDNQQVDLVSELRDVVTAKSAGRLSPHSPPKSRGSFAEPDRLSSVLGM